MARAPTALLLALAVAVATACQGEDGASPSPAPSGALGPVTVEAADEAVLGLCELVDATDLDAADATFHDRSHQTLHVVAAATEVVDRAAAADLLVAKERVEADLTGADLPASFADDVETLLGRTRDALEVLGLDPPACPA